MEQLIKHDSCTHIARFTSPIISNVW